MRPANAARVDAQRAFFQQALGQARAPAAPTAAPVAASIAQVQRQAPAPAVTRVHEQPVEGQPQRYLRPGSLLDIKV